MARQHLRKYAWFVFLMAFVIGWSGVSVAAKPMQHSPSAMMMSHAMQQPCHTVNMSDHEHMHSQSMHQCHQEMIPVVHQQYSDHCQDCNPLHCQIANLAVQQVIPDLAPSFIPTPIQFTSVYQAQHLAGYWQEILRPPKA